MLVGVGGVFLVVTIFLGKWGTGREGKFERTFEVIIGMVW